jgi:hypothetical protein
MNLMVGTLRFAHPTVSLKPSYSAKAEYPVRRGLPIPSLTSLEYWITRLRG